MSDLIRDFFTYDYKNKNYFGILEVIKGKDISQKRNVKKYETHIEKALEYTMKNKLVSHMSIQTYSTWLRDRAFREDKEDKYYPFILEFESSKEYNDAVYETAIYVQYLITEFNVNKKDILIMLNNSRSIYVYVNPKTYNLKPSPNLNKIYYEMYKHIKKELNFKYVDESIIASTYKIMKTPNCYYKGGYFVPISIKELMQLLSGAKTKKELTRYRRDLSKIKVPGEVSLGFYKLYASSVNNIKKYKNKNADKQQYFPKSCGKCVSYFLKHLIEQGYRNYALVSIGIYLKNLGYTKQEVIRELCAVAEGWNHDETTRNIISKVNTIFRKNYKFSCEYVRSMCGDLGIENMCSNCPYAFNKGKNEDMLHVDAKIINDFWQNKASTRHYNMYLQIIKNNLLNKEFDVNLYKNINYRTLREISKYTANIIVKKNKDGNVDVKYIKSSNIYKLPVSFIDKTSKKLGDYIKHYFKLLTKGYKALKNRILIHITTKRLVAELNYKDSSGISKLFKKLEQLGLLEVQKNNVLSLYYKNHKIVSLQEKKIIKEKESDKIVVKQIILKDLVSNKTIKNYENNNTEEINSG